MSLYILIITNNQKTNIMDESRVVNSIQQSIEIALKNESAMFSQVNINY